jgi:pimeloyl-ACP methyl ester carboxylesterase
MRPVDYTSHNRILLALSACAVGGGLHARYGNLMVAENPSAPGGRKISLRVVVLPATTANRAADPLFYLEGGPGGAASDEASWVAQHFALLNQRHDIVLIDQRGTGGSNQVTCSTAGLSGSPGEAQIAAFVQACLASIKGKADPLSYTTPIAVDDFDQVRAALGYDKIDLYGISYGVSSALAYIQRHGAHVRAAVLDSGSLLDVHLWELVPRSAQQARQSLFARCRSSATCASAFPNLPADFTAVTTRLSKAPITSAIVDPATGGFWSLDLPTFLGLVIDDYLGSQQGSASFPRDIHATARGDWTAIMKLFAGYMAGPSSVQVMYLTISCSLDGDHTDADAALGGSSDGRISSAGRSYRTPSHRARSADRGSSATSDVVSRRMMALRCSSYFGQPGSPLVAKATQAACMVSASCCGGSVPRSGSVPLPRVSKTKGISSPWHAPRSPLNRGERQTNSYM